MSVLRELMLKILLKKEEVKQILKDLEVEV